MDAERFARIAKALADPRRFQILETIANCREVGCQRLCEQFPVAQPTMSHHLKELARAGLIEPWREGQFAFYRFRDDVFAEYSLELASRLGIGTERSQVAAKRGAGAGGSERERTRSARDAQ